MEKTTLSKNKEGYGYKYTELAEIHKYLEENNMKYYQEIETDPNTRCDYIMTYRFIDGKWEEKPKRGCKVVEATLAKIDNPAQQQGSALTYARRYSLLMAFGLATEDDDAQSLSSPKKSKTMTLDEAKEYIITFGKKHPGEKLGDIMKEDKGYLDWLLNSEKTDETVKQAIKLIFADSGEQILTDEEKSQKLLLTTDLNELFIQTGVDREQLYKHYKVDSDTKMTIDQLKDAIEKLKKKVA